MGLTRDESYKKLKQYIESEDRIKAPSRDDFEDDDSFFQAFGKALEEIGFTPETLQEFIKVMGYGTKRKGY